MNGNGTTEARSIRPRNIIVLLGGPGAGKGTQAQSISTLLKVPHISTGELLRSEVARQSPLGLRARATMNAGGLVSDEIVNEMVRKRLLQEDCSSGCVLDGYPRDNAQAVTFGRTMSSRDRLIVIDIETDLDKVIPRLTGRRTCVGCRAIYHLIASPPRKTGICDRCGSALAERSDDCEQVIRQRFKAYRDLTSPLVDYYKAAALYHRVDGMQAPEKVAVDIAALLDSLLEKRISDEAERSHAA